MDDDDKDDKLVRATDWLNEKLYPMLGPPPLGPYDDDEATMLRGERGDDVCPVCGEPMRLHERVEEPETGKVWLHCPGGPAGQQLEAGMPS